VDLIYLQILNLQWQKCWAVLFHIQRQLNWFIFPLLSSLVLDVVEWTVWLLEQPLIFFVIQAVFRLSNYIGFISWSNIVWSSRIKLIGPDLNLQGISCCVCGGNLKLHR
jgi:hypothetical protein